MEFLTQLSSQGIILGMAFATIVFSVGAFGYWFVDETPLVKRRLKAISKNKGELRREDHREGAFHVRWVEPVAKLVLPTTDWMRSRLRSRLVHAGYRSNTAYYVYGAAKAVLTLSLPLMLVGTSMVLGAGLLNDTGGVVLTVLVALAGFYMPDIYLIIEANDRQRILRESFPDALDLMVVCVEAGLGLDAAIQRVSRELEKSHPELGEELGLVNLEMKAGRSKEEALKSLAYRTGLPEIKALASILIQAEHFGTSIGASLSGHADDMRDIRIQNAREKAAKLPVKMVFPIMLCIFPALFLVILGPAVIKIFKGFGIVFGAT